MAGSFRKAVCQDIHGHITPFLRTPEVTDRWHAELVELLAEVDAQITEGRRVEQARRFRRRIYDRLHEARRLQRRHRATTVEL